MKTPPGRKEQKGDGRAGDRAPKGRLRFGRADGVPWGTRTLDLLLRRQLLYPAELKVLERVMGIEPT